VTDLRPAPKGYPIKLVRDATEGIINSSGKPGELFYDELPDTDRAAWLRKKLLEEVGEYLVEPGLDELADVLAVVEALTVEHDSAFDELCERMWADPRGGFLTGRMMRGYHPEFDGQSA
jgi:predicted house-cleaning noncanonical NTP pyrophosphatase (MazG superfamily)